MRWKQTTMGNYTVVSPSNGTTKKGHVDISMPNYVHKNLVKYKHEAPRKPQHCPYEPAPKKYGKESNEVTEEPESLCVNDEKK